MTMHTEPTQAQKEAGNYKKHHVRVHGLDISIENPRGSIRSGTGKDGKGWAVRMPAHYGYIKRTTGADGDHVDCYLGPHIKSPHVFVIDQVDADNRRFDEHKCMIGYASKDQALAAYRRGFSDGKGEHRIGGVREFTVDQFKHWLDEGDTTRRAAKRSDGGRAYADGGPVADADNTEPAAPPSVAVPAFDPSKPFETVGAPAFDPSKPYEAVQTPQPDVLPDVAKGAGTGLVKGVTGLAGLSGDMREVNASLASKASKMLGYEVSPETVSAVLRHLPIPGFMGPTSNDLRSAVESQTGPLYEPKTGMGKFAETVGEFAPAVIGGPESLAAKAATRVLAPAATSTLAGEVTKGTSLEPYAKPAGALAGAVGASGIAHAVREAMSPQLNVAADLGRAITRDNTTPQELMQKLTDLRTVRPDATLADVGGENVRGLVERVAQTPGAGRTVVVPNLTSRQQRQLLRITDDLQNLTGSSKTAVQAVDETMAARKAAADPLYDKAMNFNARAVPEIRDAWTNETGQGWGKQILNSPDFRRTLETEYGITDPTNAPLMKVIDAWKKEADGIVGEAVRNGNNNRARVIGNMRDRLIDTVDRYNPHYATARDAWAGRSQYLEAIEDGRNVLNSKISAEELGKQIASMSDAQKEAFRIGAVSAIRGKMGNDPAKMADMTKYLRSPEMRGKIAAIMPTPETADSWAQRLNYEVGSSELMGRALGNSATARRLAEKHDADSIAGDLIMDALSHGASLGILRRSLMSLPSRARDTLRSRSDGILAELLTTPQPLGDVNSTLTRAATRAPSPLPLPVGAATYTTPMRVQSSQPAGTP